MTTLITIADARQEASLSIVRALEYVEIADGFTVSNAVEAQLAADQLSAISRFIKGRDERRLEITRPYDEAKSEIKAAFDEPIAKAREADKLLREALAAWTIAEQKRVAEENRKAAEAAAAERAKAAALLAKEQERLASVKTEAAQERAQERVEAAAARVDEAQVTTAPVVASPSIKGFGMRDNWVGVELPDSVRQMVAAIAGCAPSELKGREDLLVYLTLDMKTINATIKSTKGKLAIPGVRAENKQVSAVR